MRCDEKGDKTILPHSIASRKAFENAMTVDIAMGDQPIQCSIF